MKYSQAFEESYNFYLLSIGIFDFCGTLNARNVAIPCGDKSAKECFYYIDTEGKNYPYSEHELLNQLLHTKASVNFQIKEWSQGRSDGTLPLHELSKRKAYEKYPYSDFSDLNTLEWINGKPVYYKDIETQYNLPEWVINAVERQKVKFYA